MSPEKPKNNIAYILRKFPVLSETFILNELLELEAQGIGIHIFSLERPNDPRFHEDLPKLKANISYVPNLSNINSLRKHSARASQKYGDSYIRVLPAGLFYKLEWNVSDADSFPRVLAYIILRAVFVTN